MYKSHFLNYSYSYAVILNVALMNVYLDAAEGLCCQPEVQFSHYSPNSGQLGCQRVSALTQNTLLLHLAPQRAARQDAHTLDKQTPAKQRASNVFIQLPVFFPSLRFGSAGGWGAFQSPDSGCITDVALPDASCSAAGS